MHADDNLLALSQVTTATLTMILLKQGLRNVWLRGTQPIQKGQDRVVGRAFTLRFVPMREDLATPQSLAGSRTTRTAIEEMQRGQVVVVDAMGFRDAGIFGDILSARMKVRGVAGLVTDGVVRDIGGMTEVGLPTWCQGVAAPPSVCGLTFVGSQEPIACGGVAVFPDDVIVADDDGAVVIPKALVEEVITLASDQERLEAWIMDQVLDGEALPGLYPPNEDAMRRYRQDIERKG